MTSCGAPDQADVRIRSLSAPATAEATGRAAINRGTVIEGTVQRDGAPFAGAYVRLLDCSGEFTAEVVSGPEGQFRFHAARGLWTVRALAPGARVARTVDAGTGVTRLDLPLATMPRPADGGGPTHRT
jgi:Protein of unknown function (DUF1416)